MTINYSLSLIFYVLYSQNFIYNPDTEVGMESASLSQCVLSRGRNICLLMGLTSALLEREAPSIVSSNVM